MNYDFGRTGTSPITNNYFQSCGIYNFIILRLITFLLTFQCLQASAVPASTIQDIQTCWEGEEGIQLHHENGVKTEQLVPKHTYVPWVTFNDVSQITILAYRTKSHNFIV